jgi:tetratricopeptide (TPR) repeat protein
MTFRKSGFRACASLLSLAAAFLCLLVAAPASAMTASDYFEDGNRLFRDDLYWAALLRYRQAQEAGLDTPLLDYNIGVSQYRAQQNIRARESLIKALDSPTLRVGAQYSLGLNAYALGDLDEALRWFRLSRDQNLNPKLAEYSRIAISRIRSEMIQDNPAVIRIEEERRQREFAHLDFRVRVSVGSDSNVFRSSSDPYIDFADPALPLVTPEVKSGIFIPVNLSARYMVNAYSHEGFYGAYRLAGRYYQDELLENGNEYIHELSFGNEYRRRNEEANREREVYSSFRVAQHDEVYYDRDNGGSRQSGGADVSDRMNYLRYGPEISFRQSHERLSVGFNATGQLWNYDSVENIPEYDHEFFLFGVTTQYRLSPKSLLRLTVEKYSRRFGQRPSFELDGTQPVGVPPLRYDYLSAGLLVRQRLLDSLWFGVEFERTEREDRYVGYNDYSLDSYGLDISWIPSNRFKLRLAGYYRLYDYPNAFAFHNPVVGLKTLETADVSFDVTYRMTPSLSLVLRGLLREQVSNDTRIAYDRNQFVLGVRWEP